MRDARPWTSAALFGALWGGLELSVGTALHLSGTPATGLIMSTLGLICLVTLRRLRRHAGVCLLAGAVAMFLKIFTMGGFFPGPLIGIAAEAVLVELAFTTIGVRRSAAVVGGAAVLALTPLQRVLFTWILAGSEALAAAIDVLRSSLAWAGFGEVSAAGLVGVVVCGAAAAGAAAGLWSWRIAGRVQSRLGWGE